eukprot:ANDGO_08281.mRNA.1 BTB/POZ domain-containing protein At2g30600
MSSHCVLNLPALSAKYVWLPTCTLPTAGSGAFLFEARAHNDIHVALHYSCSELASQRDSRYPDAAAAYEFLFGGYTNTKSLIRRFGKQVALTSFKLTTGAAIPQGIFTRFWISISIDGVLAMGYGSVGENVILRWQDAEPVTTVMYVGLSSWDSPVQYRNFYTTPSSIVTGLHSGAGPRRTAVTRSASNEPYSPASAFTSIAPGQSSSNSSGSSSSSTSSNSFSSSLSGNSISSLQATALYESSLADSLLTPSSGAVTGPLASSASSPGAITNTSNSRRFSTPRSESVSSAGGAVSTEVIVDASFVSVVSNDWRYNLFSLQQSGIFCDVILNFADGSQSAVHSFVLAAASPLFALKFRQLRQSNPQHLVQEMNCFLSDADLDCDVTGYEWEVLMVAIYTGLLYGIQSLDVDRYIAISRGLQLANICDALVAQRSNLMSQPFAHSQSSLACEQTLLRFREVLLDATTPDDVEVYYAEHLEGSFGDCQLICDNMRFACHRAALGAHSNFFFRMFSGGFHECITRECDLTDMISADVLRQVLEYCYSGVLPPSIACDSRKLVDLMTASSEFMLTILKREVERRLCEVVQSPGFAADLVSLADAWDCPVLRDRCIDVLQVQFCSLPTDSVQNLSISVVEELLQREDLHADISQNDIFLFSLNWLASSVSNLPTQDVDVVKKGYETRVFPSLRIHLLSRDFLDGLISDTRYAALLPPVSFARLQRAASDLAESIAASAAASASASASASSSQLAFSLHPLAKSLSEMLPSNVKIPRLSVALAFVRPGDDNGVFYYIGSKGHTHPWTNPHSNGDVVVSCSSPRNRFSHSEFVVDRRTHSTVFFTSPTHQPWVAVDLGEKYRLLCTRYTLRHDSSASNFLRSWDFQASDDGQSWSCLRTHRNDTSISHSRACISFLVSTSSQGHPLPQDAQQLRESTCRPYRHFRVIMRDCSSSGSDQMVLSNLELYGFLVLRTLTQAAPTAPPAL